MADDKKLLDKLRRLHDKQVEITTTYHDQMTALSDEISSLWAGEVGIGDLMKRFERHFDQLWCVRYAPGQTGRYVWNYAKDRAQEKRLMKTLGIEELELRAINYLRDADPYYVQARHPFALFVSNVNRFASETSAPDFELDAPVVAGCKHQPICTSDQEHTRRKMQDMRHPA